MVTHRVPGLLEAIQMACLLVPYFPQPWCAPPASFHLLPPAPHRTCPTPPPRSSSPPSPGPPSSPPLSPDAQPFQPTQTRTTVQWLPPPPGWVKLNFDGSVYYDGSGRASIGGAIRDCSGRLVAAFAERTEHASVGIVEARALIHGLRLALKCFPGQPLVAQGDDRVLVRLLNRDDTYTRIPKAMEDEIHTLLGCFPDHRVEHIFREGNQVADALCHEAYHRSSGDGDSWTVPRAILEKVQADANGYRHQRICKV